MTTGWVITETIFISTRQSGHKSGSTSSSLRSSRAQLLRRSLVNSDSGFAPVSGCGPAVPRPSVPSSAGRNFRRARLA